ncbi:hypothetical protein PSHT_04462 [Puccinia striiformis]|uniref:Uncharacterized protein n=1 Tax=Puccinia striiformis TaxID=27350 RepID=A0A2S4WCV8_9BASI|nr:hypothetical protein H4Q26_006539 [Puccinia striiformis f. sp. tritici PST-130]POW19626.1 hypothetical protein PSHT_04462 [Puccinia striiformis]
MVDLHIQFTSSDLILISKNSSVTKPPPFDLLPSKRPIYTFKFDGGDKRYRGYDNCAARNRLETFDRNRRSFFLLELCVGS